MADVRPATDDDVDALVELQTALFTEDAGVYEQHVDLTWPVREGRRDFERLLGDGSSLVLVAHTDDRAVGFLVGYLSTGSGTRLPVTYANLRSLYVEPAARRQGAAEGLTERFLSWARERGSAQAVVDCYAANERAQRFYERLGFASLSVSRVREL